MCLPYWDSPGGAMVKNLPANAGDTRDAGAVLGSGKSPGEGTGNPLKYFCLENPMNRGVWRATVRGVTKSSTRLKRHAHTHPPYYVCMCAENKMFCF